MYRSPYYERGRQVWHFRWCESACIDDRLTTGHNVLGRRGRSVEAVEC